MDEKEDLNEGREFITPGLTEDELRMANAFIPPEQSFSTKHPEMKNVMMMDAIIFDGKNPDEMKYLLLLYIFMDGDEDYSTEESMFWRVKIGRQNTYDYLMNLIETESIDPSESFILAEESKMTSARTVRAFMKGMKREGKVIDNTDFDVDGYIYGDTEYETIMDLPE